MSDADKAATANRFQELTSWLADQVETLANQNEKRAYWLMEATLLEISKVTKDMAETAALFGAALALGEER